jgi:hypothetical protein
LKIACSCGKSYWPSQKWIHAGCVVVNTDEVVVVNKRSKDRHKKTDARRKYLREYMRALRAKAV